MFLSFFMFMQLLYCYTAKPENSLYVKYISILPSFLHPIDPNVNLLVIETKPSRNSR